MKRRKALKSLGLGLSAGLVMPQFLMSCKKDHPGPEINYSGTVAVIGAGAAGLYAADILRSKGVKVVVLEASGQIGGRLKSYNVTGQPTDSFVFDPANPSIADFPLELGAEVVYGSDSIWAKILVDLTVPTFDLGGSINQFVLDNTPKSATDWGGDSDFNAVNNFVSTLSTYSGTGVSVTDASGVGTRGQALLNSEAGNFYGSSSDNIDAGALGAGLKLLKHDGKSLTLKATQMRDVLVSRFNLVIPKVQFNSVVQSLDYSGDTVTIGVNGGTQITADKVIVTVPLSILKAGGITFTPSLPPAMTSSLAKLGMDDCIRVLLDFKKNFWLEDSGFIWGGTTSPQYFNSGVGRSKQFTTLSLTICGPKATELLALAPEDMINSILTELDALYAGQATVNIRRNLTITPDSPPLFAVQYWSKEEFIKGGFSYPLLNATNNDRVNIGQSIGGKVFFAGEATDINGDGGTINGALASAERVSQEVVTAITAP